MKKLIVVGATLAVAVAAIAPSTASAHASNKYQRACHNDGYGSITKLMAGKRPSLRCSGAYRVLDGWMGRDISWSCPLDGTCRVRVGYNGWLWKCYGNRLPNQLREYSIGCYSGKKVWVRSYGGYAASRYMSFSYTD
jgi:hypothetical protein